MADQIESITGHLAMGTDGQVSFVVAYCDGKVEHRKGTLLEVSRLASTAGLHLEHSSAGTFRWVGKRETWSTP
jgi:hypothetical protein